MTWKVGELAKRTGVSVRTLHHYEAIGLLCPASRNEGGHRCYTDAEVERLQRILSMRELGFTLEEIGTLLDSPGYDLLPLIKLHRERVAAQLAAQQQLASRLARLQARLEQGREVPVAQLLETMEAITMIEKYLTPDQIQNLQAAREKHGGDLASFQATFAELRRLRDAGKGPRDPEVQALARRHRAASQQVTSVDPTVAEGLRRMLQGESEIRQRVGIDAELMAFLGEAVGALD